MNRPSFKQTEKLFYGIISVNIKAVIKLEDVHLTWAISYLEAYNLEIGILVNFGERNLNFKPLTNRKYRAK